MDEANLSALITQWRDLKDTERMNRFYDESIFPALGQIVVPRERLKFPQPYTHLILPVGLSPEPLILSIYVLQPERVYFLCTKASEKHLDRIVRDSGLRISQVDKDSVDETNVAEIYQKVKAIYEKWGQPERIAVDISGGKKSMIGACALAASFIGARIFYVDNTKYIQELRKPEPGSERLAMLENPYDVFGDLKFARARDLYAELDFSGAERLLLELRDQTSTPEAYEAIVLLCQAYAAWDDLRVDQAYRALLQAQQTVEKYRRSAPNTPLNGQLPRMGLQVDLLARLDQALRLDMKDNPQQLQLLKTPSLYQPLIGSLKAGALRQERRGKRDVAALLWYRLIELLSQRRLAQYNLITSRPDYARAGLDAASLLQKYEKVYTDADSSKKSRPVELPKEKEGISLLNGYMLLKALDDAFVAHLHMGKVRASIAARNNGIFAHGFRPITQPDYETFKSFALDLLDAFACIEPDHLPDWETCQFIEVL